MRRIQEFLQRKASKYVVAFVFIQIAAISSSSAQGVSVYQARTDLQRLKQTIEYHNPRVSINNPNFANDAQAIIETLSDSLSWNSFYSMVYQICALSKDSKYIIGNKSLPFQRSLLRGRVPLFPINIRILDGKIFVWNDRSQEGHFNRGDEILSINRRSAEEIIEIIYTVTPKDIGSQGWWSIIYGLILIGSIFFLSILQQSSTLQPETISIKLSNMKFQDWPYKPKCQQFGMSVNSRKPVMLQKTFYQSTF